MYRMNLIKQEKKHMKKNKGLRALLLALLLIVSIGGIYAYWAGEVSNPSDDTENLNVTIGQGQNVQTTLDVTSALANEGKKLVPAGKTAVSVGGKEANVESLKATYTVKWTEDTTNIITEQDKIEGTLKVDAKSNDSTGLVQVQVDPASATITADGQAVEVTVTVTMNEPADKAQYDQIAGQNITVDLTFSVAQ